MNYQVILEFVPVNTENSENTYCIVRHPSGQAICFDTPEDAVDYIRERLDEIKQRKSSNEPKN